MKLLMFPRRAGKTRRCLEALLADPHTVLVTAYWHEAEGQLLHAMMSADQTVDMTALDQVRRRIFPPSIVADGGLRGYPHFTTVIIDELGDTLEAILGHRVSLASTSGLEIERREVRL
jgi:hypothetical protein